jgi:hypothetical protein
MMMKRLLVISALCASLATVSFAQRPIRYILTLGGGNVVWNGVDPFVDVPLIFQISAVDPDNFPLWDAFGIRFGVDKRLATIIGGSSVSGNTAPIDFSTVGPGSDVTLRIAIQATPPYAGRAGVVVYSRADEPELNMGYALVGDDLPIFQNLQPTDEAFTKGMITTRYGVPNTAPNRVPFTLRLYAREIGLGNSVTLRLKDESIIWDDVRYGLALGGNTWTIIPEPASMVALGSGLVGLLALRRRRAK